MQNAEGDIVAVLVPVTQGYYITNRVGEQIAQITFYDKNAKLCIANTTGKDITTTSIASLGNNRFGFKDSVSEQDKSFALDIPKRFLDELSFWGDPLVPSYDIYSDKTVSASVTASEGDTISIKIARDANFLRMLMIVLAVDYFRA